MVPHHQPLLLPARCLLPAKILAQLRILMCAAETHTSYFPGEREEKCGDDKPEGRPPIEEFEGRSGCALVGLL